MGNTFLRIAVVYILIGVTLGNIMGATMDFHLAPVHAHINLLGWVAMTLFGLFYRVVPAAATTRLAKVHFWVHNIALPIQMITLYMELSGDKSVGPILGISSIVMGLSFLLFAINLWKHTGSANANA